MLKTRMATACDLHRSYQSLQPWQDDDLAATARAHIVRNATAFRGCIKAPTARCRA
jgi:hypothetical protein